MVHTNCNILNIIEIFTIASKINPGRQINIGLVSKTFTQATFAAETDVFLKELASRSRLNLETIKKFMQTAQDMSATQQSEYAGTLLALVRS